MIDVFTEELISLTDACHHPALRNARTGRPVHVAQIFRYVQSGARAIGGGRVRLEALKTPAGLRTSQEAILRFIERLNAPDSIPPTPSNRKRRQQAERELAQAGFQVGGDPK